MSHVFLLMGVSGSGKTTVGVALAERFGVPFYDGDDFHPPQNVARMARGVPLGDEERRPWLARIQQLIAGHLARGEAAVIACSALKKKYRDQLRQGNEGLCIIYLKGSFELIWDRMRARQNHFMKADMLRSQFETLEPPSDHNTLIVSVDQDVESIVEQIVQQASILKNGDADKYR